MNRIFDTEFMDKVLDGSTENVEVLVNRAAIDTILSSDYFMRELVFKYEDKIYAAFCLERGMRQHTTKIECIEVEAVEQTLQTGKNTRKVINYVPVTGTRIPSHFSEYFSVVSSSIFDSSGLQLMESALKDKALFAVYSERYFSTTVWYENKRWVCRIQIEGDGVETFLGNTLAETVLSSLKDWSLNMAKRLE